MAVPNLLYNATAKNSIITLITPTVQAALLGLPSIIVFTGAGRDKWFDVTQNSDSIVGEVASDGNMVAHIRPSGLLVTGSMTFNPSSPTLGELANLATAQTNSGIILANTLVIENVSTGTTVKYTNFLISRNFVGWTMHQQLDDYAFNFTCMPPQYLDLTSITNIIGAI